MKFVDISNNLLHIKLCGDAQALVAGGNKTPMIIMSITVYNTFINDRHHEAKMESNWRQTRTL